MCPLNAALYFWQNNGMKNITRKDTGNGGQITTSLTILSTCILWPCGLINNEKRHCWIKIIKLQVNLFVTEFIEHFLLRNFIVVNVSPRLCQINNKNISMDETPLVLLVMILALTIVVRVQTCVSYKMRRYIGYNPGSCEMVDLDSTAKGVDCVQRCNKTTTVRVQNIKKIDTQGLYFWMSSALDWTIPSNASNQKYDHDKNSLSHSQGMYLRMKFSLISCIVFWKIWQNVCLAMIPQSVHTYPEGDLLSSRF